MTQRIDIETAKDKSILLYDMVLEHLQIEALDWEKGGFVPIDGIVVRQNNVQGKGTIFYLYMSKDAEFRPEQPENTIKIILADMSSHLTQ